MSELRIENKTEGPSAAEWNRHRTTIEQLYMKDAKTLTEVQEWMRTHRNFTARSVLLLVIDTIISDDIAEK